MKLEMKSDERSILAPEVRKAPGVVDREIPDLKRRTSEKEGKPEVRLQNRRKGCLPVP
jgi:hypothetical protein